VGFQLPITIADAVKKVQTGDLVLPAIQREFVWEESQIVRLFDSLLRGYPIGSFLSWKVAPQTAMDFRFYGFIKNYHEKDNPYGPVLVIPNERTVIAVLDGQQRLTALNIGLRGSYAGRVRGGWWANPKAFPKKRLYINALADAPENDLGMHHDFRLLTEDQAQTPADGSAYWFPVFRLFAITELSELMTELASRNLGNNPYASQLIGRLYSTIHNAGALYFYEETDQDVEKVLDIFIRVNSGGTVLSYSDLLLSIATAQWTQRDAREEIRTLLDVLNAKGQGFRFPKDTILKAGLVLTGVRDVGFKVRNFNHANMAALEKGWDAISAALTLAVDLLADFGLSDATLTANSVLIPVAHYVHYRGLTEQYRTAPGAKKDRAALRGWVMRSLVKQGVWGSGLDTLLRDLRDVISEDGADGFPVARIEARMAARGKALAFTPEEVDELLELKYGAKRTFSVLALLFPHVDTRNVHHVDHIYPRGLMTPARLKADGLSPEAATAMGDRRDLLPNLQLLEGPENTSKKDQPPLKWAKATFDGPAYEAYLARNDLPGLPRHAADFDDWFTQRRAALAERLRGLLGVRVMADNELTPEETPARRE
jgi:hypothetical protein